MSAGIGDPRAGYTDHPAVSAEPHGRDGRDGGTRREAKGIAALAARAEAVGKSVPKAKEQEVLDVATEYFLEHGYKGASINEMARKSGISKESIYRYFSSKKQLFEAVILRELAEYQQQLRRLDVSMKSMDLRSAMIALGETVLGVILMDRTLALRRLLFEEARRSPDVGQHYYKIGPEQAFAALERVLAAHCGDAKHDPAVLARHFLAMASWRLILERECGLRAEPTKAETRAWIEVTVDDFIDAFIRPAGSPEERGR